MDRARMVLSAGVAALLAWAAVEAGDVRWEAHTAAVPAATADPAAVEQSFAGIRAALEQGRTEEAVLALRERRANGAHPGYAAFWLGEAAFAEGAYAAAVRHYRSAVDTDPSVADRGAAFDADSVIPERLRWIREGPWAGEAPAELADLYYLQRRIAGGCQ